MTHASDLANIFKSEGYDMRPFMGVGFQADFINEELKRVLPSSNFVSYIQASYDGESPMSITTDGNIKTVNALVTIFANKAAIAVEGLLELVGRVYNTWSDVNRTANLTPPYQAPFKFGGRDFYIFRPVGGVSEVADKFGTIYRKEQLFRIQYT